MTAPGEVTTVADARSGLSRLLAGFRVDPVGAEAVVIGAHSRAEAVLVPYGQWKALPALPAVPLLDTLRAKGPLIARLAARYA